MRRAVGLLQEAVDRLTRAGRLEALPPLQEAVGRARVLLGDIDAAVLVFDRLIMLQEVGRSAERRARAQRGLAAVALFEGRLETARHWLESARRFAASWGDPSFMESCRLDIACVRFLQGDLAASRRDLERALEHLQRFGAVDEVVVALDHLVWMALECGDVGEAHRFLDRLTVVCQAQPNRLFECTEGICRARVALADGRVRDAVEAAEAARDTATAEGFAVQEVQAHGLLGVALARREGLAYGRKHLDAAVALARKRGCVIPDLVVRLQQADMIGAAGAAQEAAALWDEVRRHAARIGAALLELRATAGRTQLALDRGETTLAHSLRARTRTLCRDLVRGMTLEERARFAPCTDLLSPPEDSAE